MYNQKSDLAAQLKAQEGETGDVEAYHAKLMERFDEAVLAGEWQLKYPADIVIPQNDDETCDVESLKTELVMAINENQANFMKIRDLYNCNLWIQAEIDKLGGDKTDEPVVEDSEGEGDTDAMITILDGEEGATEGEEGAEEGGIEGGEATGEETTEGNTEEE